VTCEVRGDLLALVHVVNLSVLRDQVIVNVFPDILEGVAGSGQQHGVTFEIVGVERQLKDSGFDGLGDVQADCALTQNTAFLPVPHDYLPVRRATESHNNFFPSLTECTADELLRFETVHLVRSVRQRLSLLGADDFVDSDEALLSFFVTLAN
jgi:hypothetical protein